jgi:hypothetical protein
MVGALGIGVGCASTWWQQVTSNPAIAVQTFESGVQIAINAAELAWPAILQAIPAANQAAVNTQFQNALSSVNHALQVLNDGVNAAAAAQQSQPNFTALMQAVSDAVSQVIAIVDTYVATPSDAGAPSVAAKVVLTGSAAQNVVDMHSAYNSLGRFGVKLH